MSRKYNVYGIGNAIMDLQLQVSEEDFAKFGLEKGTMNLVDIKDQTALLKSLKSYGKPHQASGGSAANSMIALTQLGGTAVYGCLIGDDEFGRFYSKEMSDLGITLYTHAHQGGTTGSSVILITPDAERTMNTHLGVSAEFSPEHISSKLIGESEWLFIEGYLFSTPEGQHAVKRAITYAMKRGTKIAVVFSDTFIVNVFGDELRSAVKYADLVVANFSEAQAFTGKEKSEEVFDAFKRLAPSAVMTMGEKGAMLQFDGTTRQVESCSVEAVDVTGAGDMFAGSLLYGLTNGLSSEDSAKLACFMASKVVGQLGPRLKGSAQEIKKEGEGFLAG